MIRLVALALLALATPALAAEVDLIKGRLSATSQTASQVIAVRNNTNAIIASAKVECGFYSGEVLSGSGFAYLHDIEPGQTAQGEVVGFFGGQIAELATSSTDFPQEKEKIGASPATGRHHFGAQFFPISGRALAAHPYPFVSPPADRSAAAA
jgi:hypothetical protein